MRLVSLPRPSIQNRLHADQRTLGDISVLILGDTHKQRTEGSFASEVLFLTADRRGVTCPRCRLYGQVGDPPLSMRELATRCESGTFQMRLALSEPIRKLVLEAGEVKVFDADSVSCRSGFSHQGCGALRPSLNLDRVERPKGEHGASSKTLK